MYITKYIHFITPGVVGGKIKVILLTGSLSYILKKNKNNNNKFWTLPSCVSYRDLQWGVHKSPLTKISSVTSLPSHRNSRCKDSSALIFRCRLWKHLSHFVHTPLSLPFSVIFAKNKFLKYITGLKPPSHSDKCHSGNRTILTLFRSCSVCFSKRSVQSKLSSSRTPQIIRIF